MKKLKVDLAVIADVFDINDQKDCPHLKDWLDATVTLNDLEQKIADINRQGLLRKPQI